ncbi:hypothetical protein D6C77_08992 [Aureobasidium pullulans]|nr:hypothetical protein E4T52_16535 [Aureobasidium sp. EXF-3400]TIA51079.1 hypothetical protein D6C77_08992 [Aureobasidium pullulans]
MSSVTSTSRPVSPIPPDASQQPLCMLDLELYHHFMFTYSNSVRAEKAYREEVGRKIVDLSHQHSYVLHNCLALSALQLFRQDRTRTELWERACYLQGIAIEQVQPILINMTQDDSIAALIFASNTAAFSRAEYMHNPHQFSEPIDPIDKIIESFQLSRGISMVAARYWPYLQETWVGSNMPSLVDEQEEKMRSTLKDKFSTFQSVTSLALGQENPERRKVTLKLVDKTFRYIAHLMADGHIHPEMIYLADAWAVTLPVEYREMLEERRPVALVLLAYYAVLISLTSDIWHLDGWPTLLIDHIAAVLDPGWSEFLRWPQEVIQQNSSSTHLHSTPRVDD